jgi:hypothetical protein
VGFAYAGSSITVRGLRVANQCCVSINVDFFFEDRLKLEAFIELHIQHINDS